MEVLGERVGSEPVEVLPPIQVGGLAQHSLEPLIFQDVVDLLDTLRTRQALHGPGTPGPQHRKRDGRFREGPIPA